jgi:hypothetical protein
VLLLPRLLTPEVVRMVVEPGRPGAYALGHSQGGKFEVGYVGRSDACLQTRLVTHNYLWRFEYFIFRQAASEHEAYVLECEFWHSFKDQVQNLIHPASPSGSGLSCRYCGFAANIVRFYR